MLNLIKRLNSEFILSSICYILMGITLLTCPELSANIIAYLFGAMILILGLKKLIIYHQHETIRLSDRFDLLIGAIALGVGVFIFFNPEIVLSILPFIAGIFMIVEAFSFFQSSQSLKENKDAYTISLVLMAILLIGGIIILMNPFRVATTVLMIIGAFFIFDGVSQLWSAYQVHKLLK